MKRVTTERQNPDAEIIRDETIALLCDRYRIQHDLAERIVEFARDVDHAHALAELMR